MKKMLERVDSGSNSLLSLTHKCICFCVRVAMSGKKNNIDQQILSRIYGHGRGWVFTPNSFKDLGSRDAIASALKRYKQSGFIRQLDRGLYDYPKTDPGLGLLQPSTDDIVKALAGRDAARLQPTGAYAANLLRLSTQVPMKVVYLTDSLSRTVEVGNRQIILKRTTPRNMATAQLDRVLDDQAKSLLMKDIRYAPAWIADIIHDLVSKGDTE